jgi:hypothetical protein
MKKIIFTITLMAFTLISSASPARRSIAPEKTAQRAENIGPLSIKQGLIVAAENEQAVAASKSQAAADKKDGASGPGPETAEKSSKNSGAAETKPLKPFVPSEKIPADQAVDFPVDI